MKTFDLTTERPFNPANYQPLASDTLVEDDLSWLTIISGRDDLDSDWIAATSSMVSVGSISLGNGEGNAQRTREVTAARYRFTADELRMRDPGNRLDKAFDHWAGINLRLRPTSRFIGTNRLLASLGINNHSAIKVVPTLLQRSETGMIGSLDKMDTMGYDALEIAKKYPGVLNKSDETIDNAAEELGENHVALVNEMPHLLYVAKNRQEFLRRGGRRQSRQTRKPRTTTNTIHVKPKPLTQFDGANSISAALSWQGDISKVAKYSEQYPKLGFKRSMVHARLFARYGSVDFVEDDVAELIDLPLRAHMGAVILGKPYTPDAVREVNDMFRTNKEPADQQKIKSVLTSKSKMEEVFGTKLARAYDRFHNPVAARARRA